MWINSIQHREKSLSPVELLVLTTISTEFIKAKDLLAKLDSETEYWTPDKGSIYPVLYRLSSRGLLISSDKEKMAFKQSLSGTNFLSSSLNSVLMLYEATLVYFASIAESIVQSDPIGSKGFLKKLKGLTNALSNTIQGLEDKVGSIIEDDERREIQIK